MRLTTYLGAGLLGLGALLAPLAATSEEHDAAWVERRVQQWQPTAKERRWESIGWASDLRSALRLAKEHQRPVFLFTLDGRMNVGRC
ncbi:MAG TPA: hypothetical protein VFB21_02050 [Chthonomonadaceae bacterium]|nr:hypothetical protein [Chthonomonadaceae bacterium]